MRKVQSYQEEFEKQAKGLSNHDRKVLVQDFFVPLKEYIDFSFAHNGYREVLEYFKRKERPRDIMNKKLANPSAAGDNGPRQATQISISGINMKNEQKNINNDKSNLSSRSL